MSIFLFTANLFMCNGDLAETDGSFIEDALALASYTACDGTPEWLSFALQALTYIPFLFALLAVFGPMIGGLMANPVVGTIAATIIAGSIITGFVLVLTSTVN